MKFIIIQGLLEEINYKLTMIDKKLISKSIDDAISKCGRNKIPSTSNGFLRLSSKVRKAFDNFTDANCGENYNPNERIELVIANGKDEGKIGFSKNGSDNEINLSEDDQIELDLAHEEGLSFHAIHNHPNKSGYKGKLPECLSPEDIMTCISHDWCKSITAVHGGNKSKMILMKGKDFHFDFESMLKVNATAEKLKIAYTDYMKKWQSETNKVYLSDDGSISKRVIDNLPKGTTGIVKYIHEEYERIAQENIGSFEENIKSIRDEFNDSDLDLSIEW